MTNLGLAVSDIVNVQVSLSPIAAAVRNFGVLLVVGDSDVIDVTERRRLYSSADAVASDFGSSAPEYQAALLYFSQSPQPQQLYIGRWARTATHGTLQGAVLSSAQQSIDNFTGIANGGLNISIDGVQRALAGLDLTAQTNLNGVASVLQTALATYATVTWDAANGRFIVKALSTGINSGVSFASAPGGGTDLSALLGLRNGQGGYSVAGIAAESLPAAVALMLEQSNDWYGLQIAASVVPADADILNVAQQIEGAGLSHIFGVTTQDAGTLNSASSADLASQLKALTLKRTFTEYCSTNGATAASVFGRAFTVDFNGNSTTITLKFKQLPGVAAESLTKTQADALKSKKCNHYVRYNNDTAILQEGVMCNGFFFDEVHGTDWLQNDLQTDIFNALYTSPTKIPQTDPGMTRLIARLTARMQQAVANGLIAPGQWNGPPIGALNTGDYLSSGFYIYAPPMATQSQADREARKTTVIQIACKLAGAIHFANILVNVNR